MTALRQDQEDAAVRWFSDQMRIKLNENRHKGGWKHDTDASLLLGMYDEIDELVAALKTGDAKEIARECAGVANFAMFIADKYRYRKDGQG